MSSIKQSIILAISLYLNSFKSLMLKPILKQLAINLCSSKVSIF
nr:MAG TPA: hypothetical protein [Caudoviricetes sp.]